jgi:hypothetical protein
MLMLVPVVVLGMEEFVDILVVMARLSLMSVVAEVFIILLFIIPLLLKLLP